jgi:urea transport system ATP-binding protein
MKRERVVLYSEKVTVAFDGFIAVNQMDFRLEQGELRFLIGPNGAGKTTLLDVICGKVKPSSGKIVFNDGIDITKKKEHQIAQLGIGRKFQAPSVFNSLSVLDNVELAMQQQRSVFSTLGAKLTGKDRERLMQQLDMIGLCDKAEQRAGGLSHGEKQWLEIGMMLIQDPAILLLDEPVAGMTDKETEKTGWLLQEIVKQRSVVVVEHDMEFVRNFASKVTVMHEGKLLKEGSMEEVQRDERVAEVYLGKKAG